MDEPERRAVLLAYRAEGSAARRSWRREATLELADAGAAPSVAAVQALMRNVHALRQGRLYRAELARRQIAPLTMLLVGAVVFFVLWALAGGFEWILSEDVDVTLAMVLVNGVLFGFLGGLLSVSFSLLSTEVSRLSLELRSGWSATIARVFVGAAVAIPIAFFLESGLLNLGNVTPALDIALCFVGGFSERWLVAQFDRFARRPEH
jgi:small-conductance mechanosensitive channel